MNKCVYVFSLGFDNLYKIGQSQQWQKRLKDLQEGNPMLEPVAILWPRRRIPAYGAEQSIHGRFRRHRQSREIFRFNGSQLQWLFKAMRKYGNVQVFDGHKP